MAECNDYWCEYYEKNKGNCDQCHKNNTEKETPDVRVLLKKRAVKLMELDEKSKQNGQTR